MFQSTRPHGARPSAAWPALMAAPVSIHAPARGATRPFRLIPECVGFNPRARTGRDHAALQDGKPVYVFQSTRPHGARRALPVLR